MMSPFYVFQLSHGTYPSHSHAIEKGETLVFSMQAACMEMSWSGVTRFLRPEGWNCPSRCGDQYASPIHPWSTFQQTDFSQLARRSSSCGYLSTRHVPATLRRDLANANSPTSLRLCCCSS